MWSVAAGSLLLGLLPCGWVCLRGDFADAIASLQTAAVTIVLALLAVALASSRPVYLGVALVVATLSFADGIVFVRFLERWR